MHWVLPVILALAVAQSGCIGLTSADSAGGLSISPANLDFGGVPVGSTKTDTVTLTNSGSAPVTLSQTSISNEEYSLSGLSLPATIEAGQQLAFTIRFAPAGAGPSSGTATIVGEEEPVAPPPPPAGTDSGTDSGTRVPFGALSGAPASFAAVSGGSVADRTLSPRDIAPRVDEGSLSVTVAMNGTGLSAAGPTITSQPVNQSVTIGQTASFGVTASGTDPLSYQWKKNSLIISGAAASTYTTPPAASADSGAQFTVTVSDSVGEVTSSAAILTVTAAPVAPSITSPPANRTVVAGQTAAFSVTAAGTAPLVYQWRKNNANISGATAASYTTPATTTADNNAKFTVVVSNSAGSVTSNAANLSVTAVPVAPSITSQPANRTVIAGQTAAFSVTATGTAPMSYQWRKNSANINGATASSYSTPATTTADNGAQFSVMVTNSVGNITSNAASLTVNAATLLLSANPGSLNFANVNVGSSKVLPVTISNSGNSSVSIGSVSLSGPGFSASGVSSGQTLNPGQSATLNVTFAPAGAGSATGSVTVASNATNSPASVSLSGSGVQPVQHSATLTWNASTSSVVGYHAYRGTTSGGPYTKLTSSATASPTYTDSTVQSGQTYYYVVTAVASSGTESVNSNETQAIIPTP